MAGKRERHLPSFERAISPVKLHANGRNPRRGGRRGGARVHAYLSKSINFGRGTRRDSWSRWREAGRIFGARISTVVATAIFNRADVGESVRVRGWGGEGQRQSADRHRTTDAARRGGWPGRVKGETGLLMESHCSLIKSFARRREGARRGAARRDRARGRRERGDRE